MSTRTVRVPAGRRPWVEPLLWLGVPALVAVAPWAGRQWSSYRIAAREPASGEIRLTGDTRRDRLALLERAWTAARPRSPSPDTPFYVQERFARREAAWLTEIALQLLPLDPVKGERAVEEAVQRTTDLPERMGPEDLVAPSDTPTARLLRLADACRSQPRLARKVRQAAVRQARAADWPASRAYALCLIAHASASVDPRLARALLNEAHTEAAQVPAEERAGPLAALAGASPGVEPPEMVQTRVDRALGALAKTEAGPGARAVTAALIAPAAPGAAARLAKQAVEQAMSPAHRGEDGWLSDRYGSPFVRRASDGEGWPPSANAAGVSSQEVRDSHLRRVAAALALSHPALARRAAGQIQRGEDRSGALVEIAMLREDRDPEGAMLIYRQALQAADQIRRPVAARRAARVRAAMGLAAFDAGAAGAVIDPMPPRLIALQINEFASRLARTDPEAALSLVERVEAVLVMPSGPRASPFGPARAAIAEQIARRDPRRAAALLPELPGRRGLDGWLALARGMEDRD
jgi:hypothetical protein